MLLENPGTDVNSEIEEVYNLPTDGSDIKRAEFKYRITGYSALHHACARGYKDVASLLIEKGANVNRQDSDGRTALHETVRANTRWYASTSEENRVATVL